MLSSVVAAVAVTGCSSSKKETEAQTKAQTEAQETEKATEAAAVEEAVSEAAETVEEAVSEAAGAAEEAVSEAAEAVEEQVSEAEEAVKEAATEAAEAVEEQASEAEEAVKEAATEAETIVEEASEAAEAVEEAATEAAEAVEEASEAAEAVEEAVTEAAEAVEEAATEAAEAVEEAATEAAEAVEEAVTEAAEAVEEQVSEAAATLEEFATEAEEIAEEVASEAAAFVEEKVSEAEEIAEEKASEIEEVVEEKVSEAEEAAGEALAAAGAAAAALTGDAEAETEVKPEEAVEEAAEEETEAPEEEETEDLEEEETEDLEEEETEDLEEEETEDLEEEETEEPEISVDVELAGEGITGTYEDLQLSENDVVVLYMNDVHGGISADSDYSGSDSSLGYAGLAAVKAEAKEDAAEVVTVDNGDAIQGSVVTTESDGQDAMDLMDLIGYDIRIPGNHEFDYGMEAFLDYANSAPSDFICSNFIDLRTGEAVFDGYTLKDYSVNGVDFTIGYVGMCTPETIAKSTPTYFQDENENYIYGFDAATPQDLYDNIQESIDAAYEEGADFVIGLSHMGDQDVEPDWSSVAVAANTSGMDIILDGHAHSVLPGEIVTNKDGDDVLLTSTGTKLENIGVLKLSVAEDGTVTAQSALVNELSDDEVSSDAYKEVEAVVKEIEEKYAYLFVKEGKTENAMVIYDPETGDRLIRVTETNMGDFLTDAYRLVYNNDIGMLNGGSIRADFNAGDINYMGIISVFPWNTEYSVIEVPGQVILDCLEMGAHLYPEECGGFMQVSGMSYKIDTTIPTSVNINSDGEFVSVDGEYRVKDVMVGEEPLDLEKTYRVGINTYYSKEYGDGMTMFRGSKFVFPTEEAAESVEEDATESALEESTEPAAEAEVLPTEPVIDHDVIIAYLEMLGGEIPEQYADPYGEGRITLITEEDKEAETEAAAEETETIEEETETVLEEPETK